MEESQLYEIRFGFGFAGFLMVQGFLKMER